MEEEEKKELVENLKKENRKWTVILTIVSILSICIIRILTIILSPMAAKPIIYIYPEKEQEVTVSVSNPEKFTTTYPKYEGNWQVISKPNGELTDIKTGRKLYALYWEGKQAQVSDMKKGFVVKGEDTAKFLEEKLEILGLNEREAEEFIIYWLPKMEHNQYNYIYFKTTEEIDDYMQLEINPKPETLIRVMMEYKALKRPIEIEKQEIEKVERKGYTIVEWGGTEIK